MVGEFPPDASLDARKCGCDQGSSHHTNHAEMRVLLLPGRSSGHEGEVWPERHAKSCKLVAQSGADCEEKEAREEPQLGS